MHVNHAFQNGNITFKFASETYKFVSPKSQTGTYPYIQTASNRYSV